MTRLEEIRERWAIGPTANLFAMEHAPEDVLVLLAEIDRLRKAIREDLEEHWCVVCERGGPYNVAAMLGEPMPNEGEAKR